MNDNSIINETLISRDNLELYKNETDKKIRNHVENKISENIDETLTKSGFSADSSVVGEKIDEINDSISTLGNEINQNKTDISTNKNDIKDLQNQDSVLSSRIDNLSTLAEGSTTGDAELADIRVGIDGTIYANAGTAVREQVSELKQDLSTLTDHTNLIDFKNKVFAERGGVTIETTSDGTIKLSGTGTIDGGRLTPISNIMSLSAGTYFFRSEYTDLVMNDNTTKSALSVAGTNGNKITLSEDTEVFIGLNIVKNKVYNGSVKGVMLSKDENRNYLPAKKAADFVARNDIEVVANNNEKLRNELGLDITIIPETYIQYMNGREVSLSAYFTTDYIPCNASSIVVKTKVGDDLSGIAFYDEKKKYISGYNPYADNETETTLNVPNGACYVRISCMTGYKNNFVCKHNNIIAHISETIGNLSNKLQEYDLGTTFWTQAMWKILCIGDSLTSGANYKEEWGEQTSAGASIDENYPRMLGRIINGETTNAGFSGYSASNWWNGKKNAYTFSNYDTFIIWLGTNNGLTDTLDTDVNPYTDYNDFAETETGYYCKIIEKIKSENGSCLIVLTKVFASKGSKEITNLVIDKIAQKYGLPVIDNSDLGAGAHPELHVGMNNPHFGKAGNAFIANRYVKELEKYFAENPLRCEYHYTSRTN